MSRISRQECRQEKTNYTANMIKYRPTEMGRPAIPQPRLIFPHFQRMIATCVAGGAREIFFEKGRQPAPSTTALKTPDRLLKVKVCLPRMLVTMWMLRATQRPRRGRGGVRQSRGIRLAPPKSAGMPEERRTRKELQFHAMPFWAMPSCCL